MMIIAIYMLMKQACIWSVKLTWNTIKRKFLYSGQGIAFNASGSCRFVNGFDELHFLEVHQDGNINAVVKYQVSIW